MKTYQANQAKKLTEKLAQACVAQYQKLAAQIEQVRSNVTAEFREAFGVQERLLQHALNEAEALAWETDYPHLIFPTLAQERVTVANNWWQRQQLIRKAEPLYALAA